MTLCIVVAPGPSLTPEVAEQCRGHKVMAVNDAYKLVPFADYLFAYDGEWWKVNRGCPNFNGEKWSTQGTKTNSDGSLFDDKRQVAEDYGLKLVKGRPGEEFSRDPNFISYGGNSGFGAVQLVKHWWFNPILLVGFDMKSVDGKSHFFGEHKHPLKRAGNFKRWVDRFTKAAKTIPAHIEIINCTPGSALTCFPQMELREALRRYASRAA